MHRPVRARLGGAPQPRVVALEQGARRPGPRRVFLRRHAARAGRDAPPEVVVQAGALLPDVAREHPAAGGQPQGLGDRVDRLPRRPAARIGAEIAVGVGRGLGDDRKGREGPRGRDLDIRVALVVLEQDVVLGLVFLDHRVFEHERLKLRLGHDNIKVPDLGDHADGLGAVPGIGRKILGVPVFQRLGLAHVDDLPRPVLHDIHARLIGQAEHAGLQFFKTLGQGSGLLSSWGLREKKSTADAVLF